MTVFLVGFMGCGKSFTGKHLSIQLSIPFIDMDEAIEEEQSKSITDIFEEDGEFYFRQLENDYLKNLGTSIRQIISTGGGSPCYHDNMDLMNRLGTTIFIDTDKEIVVERLLNDIDKRPLLKGMNQFDLEFFYDRKMKERRPFYEQASFHCRHQDIEVISSLIKSLSL